MNRLLGLVLAAVLAVGVVVAIGYSALGRLQSQRIRTTSPSASASRRW